jgi:hypothetical protein
VSYVWLSPYFGQSVKERSSPFVPRKAYYGEGVITCETEGGEDPGGLLDECTEREDVGEYGGHTGCQLLQETGFTSGGRGGGERD